MFTSPHLLPNSAKSKAAASSLLCNGAPLHN
jgi:hypothetical protein